jgi:hypothetical protein
MVHTLFMKACCPSRIQCANVAEVKITGFEGWAGYAG